MAKRRKWNAQTFHFFDDASELKMKIILAHLGELFYKEFSQFRKLDSPVDPPFATKSETSHRKLPERKVANA